MLHIIIGKGNLGLDIYQVAKENGHDAVMMSRSEGFYSPHSIKKIIDLNPEYVWYCAGSGSIDETNKNPREAIETNVIIPMELMSLLPKNIALCLFSSDYAYTATPNSTYALTKQCLERYALLVKRPKTSVIRVTSLYGNHFPKKCLAGRLLENLSGFGEKIALPSNKIKPTPTRWIANNLICNLDKVFRDDVAIHNLVPRGDISVCDFAKMILPKTKIIASSGYDTRRPPAVFFENTLTSDRSSWLELWDSKEYRLAL